MMMMCAAQFLNIFILFQIVQETIRAPDSNILDTNGWRRGIDISLLKILISTYSTTRFEWVN